ncbi:MAG: hypothetical protein HYT76_02190 [Deltaproteobacteria bacterium]|nr:hypothetical protein [Deltaproteobacteria bacterium]
MTSSTIFFTLKVVLSGLLIAAISTLAKSSPKWAAFLTALPFISIISVIWIYTETKDFAVLESYMKNLFIWILPTLVFYLAAIYFFRIRAPFPIALGLSVVILSLSLLLLNKTKWIS